MNITDTKGIFKAAHEADDSVLMIGLHGIGKSDVVKTFGKENNFHVETLFLNMMDVGDLLGMPRTVENGTSVKTVWSEADWFQNCTDAAFPKTFNFSDLSFKDKEFEAYVKKSLDI